MDINDVDVDDKTKPFTAIHLQTTLKSIHLFGRYQLPNELFMQILSYLPTGKIVNLMSTSKLWNSFISKNKLLWQDIELKEFPKIKAKHIDKLICMAGSRIKSFSLINLSNISSIYSNSFGLRNLHTLVLSNCLVNTKHLKLLFTHCCKTLKHLEMKHTQYENLDANILDKCTLLESIDFSGWKKGPILLFSNAFKSNILKSLRVNSTETTDVLVKNYVRNKPNLQILDIGNSSATARSLMYISYKLANLVELNVDSMNSIALLRTHDAIRELCYGCKNLQILNISSCPRIDVESCTHLTQLKLRKLSIEHCGNVNDAALQVLSVITCLEVLSIASCTKVSDIGIASILETCRLSLTSLSIAGLPFITGNTIEMICENSNMIQLLDLSNLERVDERYFLGLVKKKGRKLKFLRASNSKLSQQTKGLLGSSMRLNCI